MLLASACKSERQPRRAPAPAPAACRLSLAAPAGEIGLLGRRRARRAGHARPPAAPRPSAQSQTAGRRQGGRGAACVKTAAHQTSMRTRLPTLSPAAAAGSTAARMAPCKQPHEKQQQRGTRPASSGRRAGGAPHRPAPAHIVELDHQPRRAPVVECGEHEGAGAHRAVHDALAQQAQRAQRAVEVRSELSKQALLLLLCVRGAWPQQQPPHLIVAVCQRLQRAAGDGPAASGWRGAARGAAGVRGGGGRWSMGLKPAAQHATCTAHPATQPPAHPPHLSILARSSIELFCAPNRRPSPMPLVCCAAG